MATILQTSRLHLRRLRPEDAPFILRLLNEPSFIEFIGDRGVRTLEDATAYILNGPVASYQKHGFGLYLVEHKASGVPMGICGLLKRDTLEDVDVGYAFVPEFWGQGFALEAVAATLAHARESFGIRRIVAITNPDNYPSIGLLEKLGFGFEGIIRLGEGAPEVKLFGLNLTPSVDATESSVNPPLPPSKT